MNSKKDIQRFLLNINSDNLKEAHADLKKILVDKTKKKCKIAYEKVKRDLNNK